MRTIHLRCYEELNEFLPIKKRKVEFPHSVAVQTSVKDLIESFNIPHTQVQMIMVNGEQQDFSYNIHDNDRVSVYPFFHSFDINSVSKIHHQLPDTIRFLVDQHLGSLARYLRILGIDTAYNEDLSAHELVEKANFEDRILITKNHSILKWNELKFGYFVYADDLASQLKELVLQFKLRDHIFLFSRCLECNTPLNPIEKGQIKHRLPPKVQEKHDSFSHCQHCDKIYWKGTHYQRMQQKIENILKINIE
jgi:hypothetical protein